MQGQGQGRGITHRRLQSGRRRPKGLFSGPSCGGAEDGETPAPGEASLVPREGRALRLSRQGSLTSGQDGKASLHQVYLVGAHVIIYRAMPNKAHAERVGIIRILHQRMSLARHV